MNFRYSLNLKPSEIRLIPTDLTILFRSIFQQSRVQLWIQVVSMQWIQVSPVLVAHCLRMVTSLVGTLYCQTIRIPLARSTARFWMRALSRTWSNNRAVCMLMFIHQRGTLFLAQLLTWAVPAIRLLWVTSATLQVSVKASSYFFDALIAVRILDFTYLINLIM